MELETFCEFPFTRVRVNSEGWAAMCCFQRPDPKSSDSPYIGNLLQNTFDEIWFSPLADEVRSETAEHKLHKLCHVPGCPFLGIKNLPIKRVTYSEYPTFLEIDLPNTHCNVGLENPNEEHPACIMCERAAPFFKPEEDRLKEILPKLRHIMPNLHQIHIQGIAEPFYKGLMFEILDWLDFDKYKDQITISTTTNGTLFKPSVRQEYLKRVPKSITNFSIDAATPATFEKIRILPVFDKVLENLYAFSKERNSSRQYLRIHNNINILNVHEVVGMVHIAQKAGVEVLEFSPTDGFNTGILVNEANCGLFRKAQKDIINECKKLRIRYNFIRPLDMGLMDRLVQITL